MSNLIEKLQGALTALVTPFDDNDAVDAKRLATVVERQIQQGIDGLVPCGTTGETPNLSAAEQELVVRTTLEVNRGRVPVVAGTGSNSTHVTVEQTKRSLEWGIDAALVVCPYYNKPTQDGMYAHFKAVYEATGAKIIAYNVPGRTVSDLMPETIARLANDGIIIGVKDATANMIRAADTLRLVGRDKPFAMLSGDDFTILPFVAVGGKGVISVVSNIAPGQTSRLVKSAAAADYATAQVLNDRIIELSRSLFVAPNPVPVKAAMQIAGWCPATTRLPLETADEATFETVRCAMNAFRGESPDADLLGWMA